MFKLVKDHRGGVTVFVTLILVPSVLFVGFMIDLARYGRYSQMLDAANQSVGNALLSYYDGLLKDTYGLFGREPVTPNDNNYADYGWSSMVPGQNRHGKAVQGTEGTFKLYETKFTGNMTFDEKPVFSLKTGPHLQNQIGDYMKYRAAVSLFNDNKLLLDDLESLTQLGDDSKAISTKSKVDQTMAKLLKTCDDLYWGMVANDRFDRTFEQKNNTDDGTVTRQTRDAAMQEVNDAADAIGDALDDLEDLEDELESLEDRLSDLESSATPEDDNADAIASCEEDINDCEADITDRRMEIRENADAAQDAIEACIDNITRYKSNLDQLEKNIGDLDGTLTEAKAALETHRVALGGEVSPEMQEDMKKELAEYETLIAALSSPNLMAQQIATNGASAQALLDALEGIRYDGVAFGEINTGEGVNKDTQTYSLPNVQWLLAKNEPVFSTLEKWYGGSTQGNKEEEKRQKDAQKKVTENLTKISNTLPEGALFIPPHIAAMLGTAAGNSTAKQFNSDASKMMGDIADSVGNASDATAGDMEGIFGGGGPGQMMTAALDKVLLVEYDLGMFSCATSGLVKDGKKAEQQSISGIPLSTKLNYLYQSEIEYLLAGGETAVGNRLAAGASLYGIFYIRDVAHSYTASAGINGEINSIAMAIGGPNPLAVIVAKIALRATVVGAESWTELDYLMEGNKVPLIKKGWKCDVDGVLSGTAFEGKGTSGGTLEMDYPGFMRALLLIFTDRQTLLNRTGDLIELNLTNYSEGCNGEEEKMGATDLSYRLADRYVGVMVTNTYSSGFLFNTLEAMGLENTLENSPWEINTVVGY